MTKPFSYFCFLSSYLEASTRLLSTNTFSGNLRILLELESATRLWLGLSWGFAIGRMIFKLAWEQTVWISFEDRAGNGGCQSHSRSCFKPQSCKEMKDTHTHTHALAHTQLIRMATYKFYETNLLKWRPRRRRFVGQQMSMNIHSSPEMAALDSVQSLLNEVSEPSSRSKGKMCNRHASVALFLLFPLHRLRLSSFSCSSL